MRRICRNEPTHVFAGVGLNAVEVVAGVLDVLRFDEGFQKSLAFSASWLSLCGVGVIPICEPCPV